MYFPQLESLAMAQFPFKEQRSFRTVVSETEGGGVWRRSDVDGARVVWRLTLKALRDSERAAVEQLFTASSGSLRSFTFLDPCDNLLRYSEDFAQSSWTRSGMVVTPGQPDPWATTRASLLTNPTIQEQRLFQSVPIPARFHYHLSVYARSAVPGSMGISIKSGGAMVRRDAAVGTNWTRYSVAGSPGGAANEIEAGIHVESGGTLEIVGMQLEAQIAGSVYRPTTTKCGVHPEARFLDDRLSWTTQASNVHDAVIQIVGY